MQRVTHDSGASSRYDESSVYSKHHTPDNPRIHSKSSRLSRQRRLVPPIGVERLEVPVDQTSRNYAWDEDEGPVNESGGRSTSQKSSKLRQSTRLEIIQRLSQLESPQLRELGKRLGTLFNVETPKCHQTFKHPYANEYVGDNWEAIQGCLGWKGLLDPINRVLKAEILRYGEFAQATYDAFDRHAVVDQFRGTSKYKKSKLLEKVGLGNRGYEITDFLYATTDLQPPKLFSKKVSKWLRDPNHKDLEVHHVSKQSSWMGFVAVCTSPEEIARLGRRDILIAWRGTNTIFEWIANLMDFVVPCAKALNCESTPDVRLETGFRSLYTSSNENSRHNKTSSARDQVMAAVKKLVGKYKHEGEGKLSITVTGHSLGGALATLCAYDIAESGINKLSNTPKVPLTWNSEAPEITREVRRSISILHQGVKINLEKYVSQKVCYYREDENGDLSGRPNGNQHVKMFPPGKIPVTVFTFAGPRVGNQAFKDRMHELGVAVLRVANSRDIVVLLPGSIQVMSYKHVGVKLEVDNEKSEYLKKPTGMRDLIKHPHNLEGYLHLVDAYQGSGRTPYKKTFRDHALVNKHADYLVPEHNYIPPFWWQEEHKGLVQDPATGHWSFPDRDDDNSAATLTLDEPEAWSNNPIAQMKYSAAMHEKHGYYHGDYCGDGSFLERIDQSAPVANCATAREGHQRENIVAVCATAREGYDWEHIDTDKVKSKAAHMHSHKVQRANSI